LLFGEHQRIGFIAEKPIHPLSFRAGVSHAMGVTGVLALGDCDRVFHMEDLRCSLGLDKQKMLQSVTIFLFILIIQVLTMVRKAIVPTLIVPATTPP